MNANSFRKYSQIVVFGLRIASCILVCDFSLLVTSLGFHWWLPPWTAATNQVMLLLLVVLCVSYSLLYACSIRVRVRAYKKQGYDAATLRRLITNGEAFVLLGLIAAWSLLVLAGQSSALPLKLMALVWVAGFVGLVVLEVYEQRHKAESEK